MTPTEMDSATAMALCEHGLYPSAQTIAGLVLARDPGPQETAKALLVLAECMEHHGELRRALASYAQALALLRSMLPSSESAQVVSVVLKYAKLCIRLKEHVVAQQALESIPEKSRCTKAWSLLAQAHEEANVFGSKDAAINCYMNIIRAHPYAVDTAIALVDHGVPLSKFQRHIADNPAIRQLVSAHLASRQTHYADAIDTYRSLKQTFEGNTDILLKLAMCHYNAGDDENAKFYFKRARTLDPNIVTHMDSYARIPQKHSPVFYVSILAEEMMRVSEDRPETMLVLARYCEIKGKPDQALYYTDQALKQNTRYIAAYHAKGSILLDMGRDTDALNVYNAAYKFSRDITTYEGIVNCCINMGTYEEAVEKANEVVKMMPKSARAVNLEARASWEIRHLYTDSDSEAKIKEKAFKKFQKAHELDPRCNQIVYAYADFLRCVDISRAKEILESHLVHDNSDTIHCKVGHVYKDMKDLDEAQRHFNIALSFNPNNADAKMGITEIEKLISGSDDEMDPPEIEESFTNDDDEEDDDEHV